VSKHIINYGRVIGYDVADGADIVQNQTLRDDLSTYTPSEVAVQVLLPGSTMRRIADPDLEGRVAKMKPVLVLHHGGSRCGGRCLLAGSRRCWRREPSSRHHRCKSGADRFSAYLHHAPVDGSSARGSNHRLHRCANRHKRLRCCWRRSRR
jgi:hypothetical protein